MVPELELVPQNGDQAYISVLVTTFNLPTKWSKRVFPRFVLYAVNGVQN